MANTSTGTCSTCGAPAAQAQPLIHVVDELGRDEVCGLCVIRLLARIRTSGDVTVFVARPTAVPQN